MLPSRAHKYMRHAATLHLSVFVEPVTVCFNNEGFDIFLIKHYPITLASSYVPFESVFYNFAIAVTSGWIFARIADILSFGRQLAD